MLFGLFGGRATTDDTIEQLEINQSYTRAIMDANSNMMRQARNRFLDDWDDDYLEQIQKLNAELRETKARLAQVEKERDNLFTTCVSAHVRLEANWAAIESSAEQAHLTTFANKEVGLMLADTGYMARLRNKCQKHFTNPWRIRPT